MPKPRFIVVRSEEYPDAQLVPIAIARKLAKQHGGTPINSDDYASGEYTPEAQPIKAETLTVNLVPPGLDSKNPNAKANYAKANAAIALRDRTAYALADLLDEIISSYAVGLDSFLAALNHNGDIDKTEMAELSERITTLQKQRKDCDEQLIQAMTGRA